ncbi:MAG: sugar ABC transporter permease [Phycisphaerae bacterium]
MKVQRRNTLLFFAFISPWLIGFVVFIAGPMLASLYLSFTKYTIVDAPRWVGWHNYEAIFRGWEPNFYNSVRVTVLYAVTAVPLTILVALAAALLLNVKGARGISVFRTLFFLPSLLPAVASAIIWAWLFNSRFGLLNRLWMLAFAREGPEWLHDERLALSCLVVMAVWGFGNTMMIFLAGLQDVPEALTEAARIDGAGPWATFRHVTLPQISPVIFFNVVTGVIAALRVFTQAFVLSIGEININRKATHFYVLNIYQDAFQNRWFGTACALAWILLVVIVLVTAVQFHFRRKWVHYND